MFKSYSIKWKLTRTYMLIVSIIVVVFLAIFCYSIKSFYFGNVERHLADRLELVVNTYDSYLGYSQIESKAKFILESSSVPDYVDAQIINTKGYIVESTSRVASGKKVSTSDVKSALEGNIGIWHGLSHTDNEKLIAVSKPLYDEKHVSGIIRFVTSVENVDKTVKSYYIISIIIGVFSLGIAFVISIFIANKTVLPIYHLKTIADHYAVGDFDKKALKFDDDELGELSDTFNYMANEIKTADKLKNDFISSISHEIRTPLTSILGWSETLLQGGTEEENRMGLEIITRESERLTRLVEDLLDFSKLEANRVKIEKDYFDLKLLVEKTGKQFYAITNKKGINLKVTSDVQKLLYYGDKDRIKQVLINVMDNAIKHTFNDGNITLSVNAFVDNKILITIEDDGEGIADFHIGNVTKMFYKGSKNITGSGIGLAISNKIIELHDGKMEFEAKKTGGMKVLIYLPRRSYEKS